MTTPEDVRRRLIASFEAVFPGLDEAQILDADTSTLPAWDSLASISLVAVVEEDFDLELPQDELPTLTTFDSVLATVSRLTASDA